VFLKFDRLNHRLMGYRSMGCGYWPMTPWSNWLRYNLPLTVFI